MFSTNVEGRGKVAFNLPYLNEFSYVELIDVSRAGPPDLHNLFDAVKYLTEKKWVIHSFHIITSANEKTVGSCLMENLEDRN